MKKLKILAFLIFSLSLTAYSQTIEKNITSIIWGKGDKCSELNSATVKSGSLKCESVDVSGKTFYIIYYNGISYALTTTELNDDILGTIIQINNNSGREIFINSTESKISKYETEEQFYKNEKAEGTSKSLETEKVANKFRWHTVSRTRTSNDGAGLQAQSRISRDSSSAGMTVIEPKSSTPTWISTIPNVTRNAAAKKNLNAEEILKTALLAKKLADKEKVTGRIYFNRYKKAEFKAVFMRIDNLEFVFPLRK